MYFVIILNKLKNFRETNWHIKLVMINALELHKLNKNVTQTINFNSINKISRKFD